MNEPMTKEKFKDLVGFKVSSDCELRNVVIVAGLEFRNKKTVSYHYANTETLADVKARMIEELWHTIYGSRRKAFAEKCDELRRCNPMDLGEYHKLVDEIITMSHAL